MGKGTDLRKMTPGHAQERGTDLDRGYHSLPLIFQFFFNNLSTKNGGMLMKRDIVSTEKDWVILEKE